MDDAYFDILTEEAAAELLDALGAFGRRAAIECASFGRFALDAPSCA